MAQNNRFAKRSSLIIYEILLSRHTHNEEKREAFAALIGRRENGDHVLDQEALDHIANNESLAFLHDLVEQARALLDTAP